MCNSFIASLKYFSLIVTVPISYPLLLHWPSLPHRHHFKFHLIRLMAPALLFHLCFFPLCIWLEDWQSQRPSSVYFLSDVMHIEAAVLRGHHVPLRVYVDSCVATANPDPNSQPRYPFVNNHGWEAVDLAVQYIRTSQKLTLHINTEVVVFV